MTVVIIGAVAAGTKTAAKLKREMGDDCRVILIEKNPYISYSGCGLPYYVEDVFSDYQSLFLNTPQDFMEITGVELLCQTLVTAVNRSAKNVTVQDLETKREYQISYDKLVLAVGARPIIPEVEGNTLPGTFTLRTPEDAQALREAVRAGMKRAVILGGGAIGLELAQSLKAQGVRTVVLDAAKQVLPGFDADFAEHVEFVLAENDIPVFTHEKVETIHGGNKVELVRTQRRKIRADAVIFAAGVRPNTDFLKGTGLDMASNGALIVDQTMQTNDPDIYAVGDCAIHRHLLTGEYTWQPLGSVAAVTGRICAQNLAGAKNLYPGVLGTSIMKLSGINVAKTGLSHTQAQQANIEVISATIAVNDKVPTYPGAATFLIRITADKKTHRLLGVQVAGAGAVDKIVDIGVTAISCGATLESLQCMDLSYAPPFSTALHPFLQAINVLLNKQNGDMKGMDIGEFKTRSENTIVLDVMKTAQLPQYPSVPVKSIHGALPGVEKDCPIVLVCEKGKQGYLAQNKLRRYGYVNTSVLEGGILFNHIEDE